MEKTIYMVYLESNINGERWFDAIPCETQEKALEVLKEERDWVLNESVHFSCMSEDERNECIMEDSDGRIYIDDSSDDYYEHYRIEEKKLV